MLGFRFVYPFYPEFYLDLYLVFKTFVAVSNLFDCWLQSVLKRFTLLVMFFTVFMDGLFLKLNTCLTYIMEI